MHKSNRLKKDFSTLAKETSLIQRQIPLQQLKADRAVQKLVEHTQGESGYRKDLELMKKKYQKVCQELQVSNKKTRDITIAWINAQQKCLTQDTSILKSKSSLVNEKTKGKIVSMKCERLEKDLKVEKTKKLEYYQS